MEDRTDGKSVQRDVMKKDANAIKMLRYSVAAFSVVSFITTLEGMKGILVDDTISASLISFGIQSIIMFLGLFFVPIIREGLKQAKKILKVMITVLMLLSYLSAVSFSSFFSYVYLSNEAYKNVYPVDYNKQIEEFMVESSKELNDINEAEINIILMKIRDIVPNIKNVVSSYDSAAASRTKEIIDKMIQPLDEIASANIEDDKFYADEAIERFNGTGNVLADEDLIETCNTLEKDIDKLVKEYDNYYNRCNALYADVLGLKDLTEYDYLSVNALKERVNQYINDITGRINYIINDLNLGRIDTIEDYLRGKTSIISEHYYHLEKAAEMLSKVLDNITQDDVISRKESSSLNKFYKSIYSPGIMSKEDFKSAKDELQEIITSYIDSLELDNKGQEDTVKELAQCVEYISILEKCKTVKETLQNYEDNVLSSSYVIVKDNEREEDGIQYVSEEAWKTSRRKDVSELISIIKSIPDIQYVLSEYNELGNGNVDYLNEKADNDYVNSMLETAYSYSRNKLESITNIERAMNYMSFASESKPAVFCAAISLFLDLTSFIIGLTIYFIEKHAESQSRKSPQTP